MLDFRNQYKRSFDAFSKKPISMLMVAELTGIRRANICRYLDKWRRLNKVFFVKHGICEVSRTQAGFYTTDPNQAPEDPQLKMFQ